MIPPKDLFAQNESLKKWLLSVTHDDRFEHCLAYALAQLGHMNLDQTQMMGANLAFATLANLPEDAPAEVPFPQPGLRHDLDVSKQRQPQQSTKD